jgi:hypothetical protein
MNKMGKKGEFTIDLIFDRQNKLYRLAESGTASSLCEDTNLGKRKAAIRGEVLIEDEIKEGTKLQANNSVYDDEHMSD